MCQNLHARDEIFKLHGLNTTFPIICDICTLQFHDWDTFDAHMSSHEESSLFFCQLCNNTYKSWSNLVAHRKACHFGEQLTCKGCAKLSASVNVDNVNYQVGHLAFGCEECEEGFSNIQLLSQHYAARHAPDDTEHRQLSNPSQSKIVKTKTLTSHTFLCDYCAQVFRRNTLLQLHVRRHHTGDRPFKCLFCTKRFYTNQLLSYHTRQHTGKRPYKCPLCTKMYTSPSALSIHRQRSHSVEKKQFPCSECDRIFTWHQSLKAHLRRHAKHRPYVCHVCSKRFYVQSNLDDHVKVHKKHCCLDCREQFTSDKELSRHRDEQCSITIVLDENNDVLQVDRDQQMIFTSIAK